MNWNFLVHVVEEFYILFNMVVVLACWNNSKLIQLDYRYGLGQLIAFSDSCLSYALLQGVWLHHASLVGASLYSADLLNADLKCANSSACDLRKTKLKVGQLWSTLLGLHCLNSFLFSLLFYDDSLDWAQVVSTGLNLCPFVLGCSPSRSSASTASILSAL